MWSDAIDIYESLGRVELVGSLCAEPPAKK
jgi:hypothetical protein